MSSLLLSIRSQFETQTSGIVVLVVFGLFYAFYAWYFRGPYVYRRTAEEFEDSLQDKKNEIKNHHASLHRSAGRKSRKLGDFPPPFPNGWFHVCSSYELPRAGVKSVTFMGQEIVVFRSSLDDTVGVVDAYCPHLGAHLGAGGTVEGNCIKCPFHGWKFDTDGKCSSIPYGKVPPNSNIRKYHCLERNGFISVWFDAEGRDPQWEPVTVPEIKNGSFCFHAETEHFVTCHIQEIPENGADSAHFATLHTQLALPGLDKLFHHDFETQWKQSEKEGESHIAYTRLETVIKLFGQVVLGSKINVAITQEGPGTVYLRWKSLLGQGIFIQCVTPVEPFLQRVIHIYFTMPSVPLWFRNFVLPRAESEMFERDIRIWNRKKFLKTPLLIADDGPIKRFRRWFQQYYSEQSESIARQRMGSHVNDW